LALAAFSSMLAPASLAQVDHGLEAVFLQTLERGRSVALPHDHGIDLRVVGNAGHPSSAR
jgi:hypothetical protein